MMYPNYNPPMMSHYAGEISRTDVLYQGEKMVTMQKLEKEIASKERELTVRKIN